MNRAQAKANSLLTVLVVCLGLVALTWIAFGQTLHYPFINYDDNNYVYENPKVVAGLSLEGIRSAFTHVQVSNWHSVLHATVREFCGPWPRLTPRLAAFKKPPAPAREGAELARTQGDTSLADQLDLDLAIYQTNLPLRTPNE